MRSAMLRADRESLPMERGIDVQISRLRQNWAITVKARALSKPFVAAAIC